MSANTAHGYATPYAETAVEVPPTISSLIDQTENILAEGYSHLRGLYQRVAPDNNKDVGAIAGPTPTAPGIIERAHRLRNLAQCLREEIARLDSKI